MTIFEAVVLGGVQGLTEFLPISSSGHLIVLPALLQWPESGLVFDVALHMGTLLAVLVALRGDIVSLWRGVRTCEPWAIRLCNQLVIGTIPAIIAGVVWADTLARTRSPLVVAAMLVLWGILLLVADAQSRGAAKRPGFPSWPQALVIGLVQACALVPGTSRSGATMTAGLFTGMDREAVARFSFLLAIPATLAAGAKTLYDVVATNVAVDVTPMIAGVLSAAVFGVLAIRLLFVVVRRVGFVPFAVYRIALGVILFWWLL